MLYAAPPKSNRIHQVEETKQGVTFYSEAGKLRLIPINDNIVRITYTEREDFSDREKPGVTYIPGEITWELQESEEKGVLLLGQVRVEIDYATGALTYIRPSGEILLKEGERQLEEFQTYELVGETKVDHVQTIDGVKDVVSEGKRMAADKLFHTRLYLQFSEEEGLYGLGQQEEGDLNLRGKTVYVHQANRKIAVPVLVSSKGYGILMDTYSPMIFNDTSVGSYFYTEADDELDYYMLVGQDLNEVVKQYRVLTGKASMLPKWAFGYMQSQERYETAEELVETAKKYREKNLGLDCIVLDWCSWEDNEWGQKSFDPKRFPDPTDMIRKLHEQDVHFMISIWPNMAEHTDNHREMKEIEGFLKASDVYNALSKESRDMYWKQVSSKLFCHGVDAWWCDSSEPLTIEWMHKYRMEPGTLFTEYARELSSHMPAWATNAYPLYHATTLYEGQRGETDKKRVCNLTRSAYTGQQRLGTILWSGDTAASWKTLKEQIAVGQSFVATGIPYWTMDIGAFFVKKSNFWYWDGDFQDTTEDAGYRELYTRWFQWAAFLPIFRAHGTDCRREMWAFEKKDDNFYDAMKAANTMRYRLMPHIYSQAGKVWLQDASMMKPLVFDYPEDRCVYDLKNEYIFCDSLLICPVTEPMYYGPGNVKLDKKKEYTVYLPKGNGWYDMNDNTYYEGGQEVTISADILRLPVFVKAGSILPLGQDATHVLEKDEIQWVVYSGKDCSYDLYTDTGDGYGYEKGEYTLETFSWSEDKKELRNEKGEVVAATIIVPTK